MSCPIFLFFFFFYYNFVIIFSFIYMQFNTYKSKQTPNDKHAP